MNALTKPKRPRAEWPFVAMLAIVGGSYVVLIVVLLAADVGYLFENAGRPATWPAAIAGFLSPEIVYATLLSLISCCITAILSVWVAVPLGYLLSRFCFPGKAIVDAIVDIPIVLPPLVIGLSLLMFFQTRAGKAIEFLTQEKMGTLIAYVALPLMILAAAAVLCRLIGVNGGTAVGDALRGVPVLARTAGIVRPGTPRRALPTGSCGFASGISRLLSCSTWSPWPWPGRAWRCFSARGGELSCPAGASGGWLRRSPTPCPA